MKRLRAPAGVRARASPSERPHGLFVGLDLGLVRALCVKQLGQIGAHLDRVGIRHRLHDQGAVVVAEGHGEGAAGRQGAGDVEPFGGQEIGTEPEARRAVVVAGDHDHRYAETAHDAPKDLVQQLDRLGGRYAAIVDVAGDEHGRRPDVGDEVDELVEDVLLVVGQVDCVEQSTEMPVGGMDESHARTLRRDPSTAEGRRGRRRRLGSRSGGRDFVTRLVPSSDFAVAAQAGVTS